jgi:Galactosyltransferase
MGTSTTVVRAHRACHSRILSTKQCPAALPVAAVGVSRVPNERKRRLNKRNFEIVAFLMIVCFLFIMIGVVLFWQKLSRTATAVTSGKFLDTNTVVHTKHQQHIDDNNADIDEPISLDFDYDSPAVERYDTLLDPNVPNASSPLVVLVLSKREHFDRRSMIRQTWGKAYTTSLYFVIGGDTSNNYNLTIDSQEQRQFLLDEQGTHRDLLDTRHPESYRSLPHKLRYAIRWVIFTCQNNNIEVNWILKVDDDMYVRNKNLSTLFSLLNPQTSTVLGQIQRNLPVQRHGKWAEDVTYYQKHPIYPPWPLGSCGYVMSRAVANIIAQRYDHDLQRIETKDRSKIFLRTYQGEDTSLGIWLAQSNVNWINSFHFVNHGHCAMQSKPDAVLPWSIGHRITPYLMQQCYDAEIAISGGHDETSLPDADATILSLNDGNQNIGLEVQNGDTSEAFRLAMAHYEGDQKAIQSQKVAEQRKHERAIKRQNQFVRWANDNS